MSGKKNIKFVSPVGTLRYPRITEADTGGQYSDGKYKTQLLVPKKEAQAFIKELEAIAKAELPGVKKPQMPFKVDKEDEPPVEASTEGTDGASPEASAEGAAASDGSPAADGSTPTDGAPPTGPASPPPAED